MDKKLLQKLLAGLTGILLIAGVLLMVIKPHKTVDSVKVVDTDKLKKHRMIGGVLIVLALVAGFFTYRMYMKKSVDSVTAAESLEAMEDLQF